jgi:ribosomal protein S27AE
LGADRPMSRRLQERWQCGRCRGLQAKSCAVA